MIQLTELAKSIENRLNDDIADSGINNFFENTEFKFNICLNSGEYKKAERGATANAFIYYINAVMKTLSSDIEGDADESVTYNASMSTSIEFLIPFASTKNEEITFSNLVHRYIASKLQAGISETLDDFLVGSKFTIPSPGMPEIRTMSGDSLPLVIYGTHYFIAKGVNSNKIVLKIDGSQVFASRVGIARRSITDGNIFSGDSAAKNTVSGTALTISFDAPLRLGDYNNTISEYLLTGVTSPLSVSLQLPHSDDPQPFSMVIADAGMNGEMGLAASINVRLIESWEGVN